jgi:hypothetical protein
MKTNGKAPYVPKYIGLLHSSERLLADAFLLVANRHERDAEVRDMCKQLATYSSLHTNTLEALAQSYGEQTAEEPERVRAALFHGARVGGLGKLRDLQDLALLVNQAKLAWLSLAQAAGSLHDSELETVCTKSLAEAEKQLAWLQTQIKHAAPQALTVAAEKASELSASLPKTPTPAALPDLLWSPLGGGLLVLLVGLIGWAAGQPWLIPSLGPTAYLQAESPAHPSAKFYNTLVGHLAGLGAGFLALALFNAWQAPVVLTDKRLVLARVGAAAVALFVTLFVCLMLKASHPPAAATTLLVALGPLGTGRDALNVAVGVLMIAALGEMLRRVRLKGAVPRSV